MNEDVIPAETEGGHISKWWLLLAAVIPILLFIQARNRQPSPKVTDTRVLGKGIADAVVQYFGVYKRFPVPPSTQPGEDFETDSSPSAGLIQILCGKEPDNGRQLNPQKINYLEGMKNAKARTGTRDAEAMGSDKWIGGLVLEDGKFLAVDGWGGYYRIRIDSNHDGEMLNPNTDEVADGSEKLPNKVIVWSAGKDSKWDTWDDNLKTWD